MKSSRHFGGIGARAVRLAVVVAGLALTFSARADGLAVVAPSAPVQTMSLADAVGIARTRGYDVLLSTA